MGEPAKKDESQIPALVQSKFRRMIEKQNKRMAAMKEARRLEKQRAEDDAQGKEK